MKEKISGFLDEFLKRIGEVGIDISGLVIDHVAYRTESMDEYEKLKQEFSKIGKQVHENIVRERRVGVFKLNTPIKYKQYLIPAIEMVAPKAGEIIKPGWEHAEIVLKESYGEFMKKYLNLNWDTSVMNSDLFSMIKLRLGEDMQVKFHLMPILDIIRSENDK
jgi:predicted metalloenzyme YecM